MILPPRITPCSIIRHALSHAVLAAGLFFGVSAFAAQDVPTPMAQAAGPGGPTLPSPVPLAHPIAGSDPMPSSSNTVMPGTLSTTGGTPSGFNQPPNGGSQNTTSALPAPPMPIPAPVSAPNSAQAAATTSTTTTTTTITPPPPLPGASANSQVLNAYTPPAPSPLPDQTLQNAVKNEAEQSFYDHRRKRLTDTFERAYEGLVPLDSNQVRDVMGRYEKTQKASIAPASGQPRGQVRIKTLSLEPGGDPPTVNVSAGYVTTITILDATGQPWPIMDLGIGGNFEVSKTGGGQGSTHVVRIMPLTRFGYGNLSVLLQDLSTPIIFKLAAGGTTVDYRFDARVPALGPNAKLSLIEHKQLEAGGATIMTFLDNAPPPDAKRMQLSGADARTTAWTMNDRMFVRTPLTMLSPSWEASVSSADGTTVYELNQTPVLLMSDGGALIRAHVLAQKED